VECLVSQIVTASYKIKDVFIFFTSCFINEETVFPAISRIEIRAKKEFDETKLNLSVYNNGRYRKVSMTEAAKLYMTNVSNEIQWHRELLVSIHSN
jgi:hypothetical protein